MYIPRLRRISDVLNEIRAEDPETDVSHYVIKELLKTGKITSMKYGNAWLVNLDELYAYFIDGTTKPFAEPEIDEKEGKMARLATSGELFTEFFIGDEKTIIRKPNLRRFAMENGIEHYVYEKAWLINREQFLKALNPKNIQERYALPRIRHKQTAVRLWNSEHPDKLIDKHIVEICVLDERVFFYKRENTWLINYDQLEVVISKYMETHAYIPRAERKARNIKAGRGITREKQLNIKR